jgi:hypothetical protein
MRNKDVDAFIAAKVLPEFHEVVVKLRDLMEVHAPDAREEISYGIPVWRARRILAVISPTKKDITFAFSDGASFKDDHGLLKGVGKVSKHVKLKTVDDINEAALRDYIQQALDHDAA